MTTTRAAVAGVLATALALAVGELLAGLITDVPSLLDAVGDVVIPLVPPAVKDAAIAMFGTNDKLALTVGTAVIAMAIGAFAGIAARKVFARGAGIIIGFGVFGLAVAVTRPLASTFLTVLSVVLATAAGVYGLRRLMAAGGAISGAADEEERLRDFVLGGEEAREDAPEGGVAGDQSRRQFLLTATAVGAAAAVSAGVGRLILRSQNTVDLDNLTLPEPVRALQSPGPQSAFGIEGLEPIVVPNEDFYRIDTALFVPQIDPETWTLKITGMVDREVELTYSDLLGMELIERYITLACVSNEVGGDLVGNAKWLGVRLPDVLDLAGVQDGATQIVGRSVDNFTVGFPTEKAFDGRDAMIAVGMNDEPLPPDHGFPARIVVPGLYGYVSATKWLAEIELTTLDAFDAYWIPRGWAKEAPIKTQSRIDVPRRGARVPTGEVVVAGVAWAPTRGIQKVEARADGGAWQECELSEPLSDDAWVQWRSVFALESGEHNVEVRATDGTGDTQASRYQPPRPDGAEGYDIIRVFVEDA